VLLACIGAAVIVDVVSPFATSAPSFGRPLPFRTGLAPSAVAIGDLNGDGRRDLATANAGGSSVSVLLSRGGGSFGARRDYPTGPGPDSVAIGDVNGDREPDLATANLAEGTVSVLLNGGDGRFGAPLDYAAGGEIGAASSVAVGDLNGDGKPDLVTSNDQLNTISVLPNKGDGSFSPNIDHRTGTAPYAVAIGDLNGDGNRDLVTANFDASTISVFLNRGEGIFAVRDDYRTTANPFSVVIGDLNGDARPDLVTANMNTNGKTVSVLLNTGSGRFGVRRDYRGGNDPYAVALGDLNGDRRPDLATANSDADAKTVSVLLNRGGGRFDAKLDYPAGSDPWAVAIGDLTGDGKADLAAANAYANTVSVLMNTPGLCAVQDVRGMTLGVAKQTITRANCSVGTLRRAYSKTVQRGRVISEKPAAGTVLRRGGRVNLVVSRGRSA
jgi:predicted NUDIX family NTP pyrophosphohydrolase